MKLRLRLLGFPSKELGKPLREAVHRSTVFLQPVSDIQDLKYNEASQDLAEYDLVVPLLAFGSAAGMCPHPGHRLQQCV